MTLLTDTKYQSHKGATSAGGTAPSSGTSEFTPVLSGVHVAQSLVFCVVFCTLLFVLFLSVIVLFVIRFGVSGDPFGIFQPFSEMTKDILRFSQSEFRISSCMT